MSPKPFLLAPAPPDPPGLHHHHGMGSVQAAMGPGWVPAGGKRHPSLPAWREADAGEAKGPLPVAASLPSPAQPLSFIPGLALFSCVGADANVTEGLPCEGCAGEEVWERRGKLPCCVWRGGQLPLISTAAPSRRWPRSRASSRPRSGPPPHPIPLPAGNVTQLRRRGHFSRCPEEYRHYCVKGRCRFLVAEAAPACM